jgi:hypothetical protein
MPTFNVSNETQLNDAIAAFDTATVAGSYTIDIAGTITEGTDGGGLPPDLYAINNGNTGFSLVIQGTGGGGGTIDGAGQYCGLIVTSGVVTISDLTIADAAAIGGAGGTGGVSRFGGGQGSDEGGGVAVGWPPAATFSSSRAAR